MHSKELRDTIIDYFMTEGPWPITRACAIECAIITVSCLIDTHTKGAEYSKSEMIELLALLNQEKHGKKSKVQRGRNNPKL